MTSIFTEILAGRSPGRFIWTDEKCFAILTIEPRSPGHTLVIPILEVDRWTDLDEELTIHLMSVARTIGLAQREEWDSDRVGLMIEGYRVPHVHIHIWPSWSVQEFNPRHIDWNPPAAALDDAAERLRSRLISRGHGTNVT